MNGACLVLLTTAALGIDVGWQPLESGGLEYIIQIDPEMVDLLRDGKEIVSEVPPAIGAVRTYRIRIGEGSLPRQALAPPTEAPVPVAVRQENESSVGEDWQPLAESAAETPTADPFSASATSEFAASDQPAASDPTQVPSESVPMGNDLVGPRYAEAAAPLDEPTPSTLANDEEGPYLTAPRESQATSPVDEPSSTAAQVPSSSSEPAELAVDEAQPMEQQVNYQQAADDPESSGAVAASAEGDSAGNPPSGGEATPTVTWIVLAILLATSVGVNLYLTMIALSQRRSYRQLASRMKATPA